MFEANRRIRCVLAILGLGVRTWHVLVGSDHLSMSLMSTLSVATVIDYVSPSEGMGA